MRINIREIRPGDIPALIALAAETFLDSFGSLVKAHRLLAILLGAFIISHLTIHITAISGPEVHTSVLEKIQPIYRNWIIEPLLMLAILTQIIIGAKLLWRRWKQPKKGFWGWAQLLSGLYIAFFLLVHTSAAMFTRYVGGLDTNFYWAAATLISTRCNISLHLTTSWA